MAEAQSPTVHRCGCRECQRDPHGALASQHQAINTLIGCLDERSQRLIVGSLASQYGRGGVARLARITGLTGYPGILNLRKLLSSQEVSQTHQHQDMPRCVSPTPPI